MTGYEIALLLIGMLCGNLGAVVAQPLNLGLFWNSVTGGLGAMLVHFAPQYMGRAYFGMLPDAISYPLLNSWPFEFLAAGAVGMAVMLVCGAVVALAYGD